MQIPQEKVNSLVSFLLSVVLFLSSVFLIYSNEIILEAEKNKKNFEKIYYSKFYFWEYVEKFSNYKNEIITKKDDSKDFSKWWLRIVWFLALWFAFSLFMIQIFKEEEKDGLVKKAFFYSFLATLFFIIFLKIYIFFASWWFVFDFSKIFEKWEKWLSLFEQIFIIFIIIFAFVLVGILYNNKINKEN